MGQSRRSRQPPAPVSPMLAMASLAGRADQGTWWAPFSEVLPNWFKIFVDLEGLARAAFSYESLLLPGQLQTEEYAAAMLVGSLQIPPMDVP